MGKTVAFCMGIAMAAGGTAALVLAPHRFLLAVFFAGILGLAVGVAMRPRR